MMNLIAKLPGFAWVAALLLLLSGGCAQAQTPPLADQAGCKHHTMLASAESVAWTGGCVNGWAEGEGKQVWLKKGQLLVTFIGTMAHGLGHGRGELLFSPQIGYTGDFVEGRMTGHGVWRTAAGVSFEGEFLNNLPIGAGVYTDAQGQRTEVVAERGELRTAEGKRVSLFSMPSTQQVCSKMGKPEFPNMNWIGRAEYLAVITVVEGRVTAVNVQSPLSAGDAQIDRTFIDAIEKAIRSSYVCSGDHVLQQSFTVELGTRAEPSWITDGKGCKHFNAFPKLDESVSWSGACVDGFGEGEGTLRWYERGASTGRYVGALFKGRSEGRGSYRSADGSTYEGDFKAGWRSGHGVQRWADGRFYEGEFVRGLAEGLGVYVSGNGKRTDVSASGGFISPVRADFPLRRPEVNPALAEAERAAIKHPPVTAAELPLVCPRIPPPNAPSVNWAGQITLRALASVIDGRVVSVATRVTEGSSGDGRVDGKFIVAVNQALTENYGCRGDFVFEQEFTFRIE